MNLNFYRLNKIDKYVFFEIKDAEYKEDTILNEIGELISDGVGVLQIKNNVLSSKKFILLAEKIKLICAQFEVIFLLTNRCDVAFALDCDGIVLEQNEIDGHIARHILGNEKIIGSYDINDKYADFYIIENNDNELSYEKIYFKKINKDCLSDNAVFLHRAYRG